MSDVQLFKICMQNLEEPKAPTSVHNGLTVQDLYKDLDFFRLLVSYVFVIHDMYQYYVVEKIIPTAGTSTGAASRRTSALLVNSKTGLKNSSVL